MPPSKPTSVLIVDDEPLLLKTVARFLERQGCRVTVCRDGTSALTSLRAQAFDVVFTDLELPGVHGQEIAEYVRKNHPKSRIVLVSAHPRDTQKNKRNSRHTGRLQKPFDLQDILPFLPRTAAG